MSWTDELYQIYEKNFVDSGTLLPISHSTANAQIEITLSQKGDFQGANVVPKEDAVTIIPVTEDSGSRGSGVAPHPLADKLLYIAGDYISYTDCKHSDNSKYYKEYLNQLDNWCNSGYSHNSIKAIYEYLKKGCIMKDLINSKVLKIDENTGKLTNDKISGIAQEDCFVRFIVGTTNKILKTWEDKTLYDSFIQYYSTQIKTNQLCYATGKVLPCTYKHSSKIRNSGDKAKLISSNDDNGFAYKGRFDDKEQAVSMSYDYSQKIHNALKWLIKGQSVDLDKPNLKLEEIEELKKQSKKKGVWQTETIENSLVLLAWNRDLTETITITGDSDDIFNDTDILDDTGSYLKKNFKDIIFRDENNFNYNDKIMIMMLDSATTGRLSMIMYTELFESDFLENILYWHESTSWVSYDFKEKQYREKSFKIRDIIKCAFGNEQEAKNKSYKIVCKAETMKDNFTRLIPCIIEKRKIPKDIVQALVNKASNPMAYKEEYNWKKVLSIACGMIKKSMIEKKGECKVALDINCTNRSYLYGRLLAVADALESSVYNPEKKITKGDDSEKEDTFTRMTNAKRYFEAFSNRPYQTWDIIYKRLIPYMDKLSDKTRTYYNKLINDITGMFEHQEFMDNSKLSPEYLHAYSCQMNEIYTKKKENDNNENAITKD